MSKNIKSNPEVEVTAMVTLKLAVGLTYPRGRVPERTGLNRDAVDNFIKHPMICWPSEFENVVKECNVEILDAKQEARRQAIVAMAQNLPCVEEGVCEVDDNAELSEGRDNGSYVKAWVWVGFEDTKWDKTTPRGRRAAPDDCQLKKR